jgi:hypothetical protein
MQAHALAQAQAQAQAQVEAAEPAPSASSLATSPFNIAIFPCPFEADGAAITFARRAIVVRRDGGDELETGRNLGAFVESVYLPCACGEVEGAIAFASSPCAATPHSASRERTRRLRRRGR